MKQKIDAAAKTKFYTEQFGEQLYTVDGLIFLDIGGTFLGENGEHYKITWKIFNPKLNLMIYHGRINEP